MKQFKFRAWEIDSQEMFYPDTTNNNEYFFSGFVDGALKVATSPYSSSKDYELMQFTGLHDQEGKEIFIGDIVKFEDLYEPYEVIINDFMQIPVIDNDLGQAALYTTHKKCCVIGNIFENPELITQ